MTGQAVSWAPDCRFPRGRITSSADIGDWLTNFYSVFNGFYGAADNVRNNFKSYYGGLSEFYGFDVNADNTILYITGHSLAGAIAGQLAQMTEGMFAHRNKLKSRIRRCSKKGIPNVSP